MTHITAAHILLAKVWYQWDREVFFPRGRNRIFLSVKVWYLKPQRTEFKSKLFHFLAMESVLLISFHVLDVWDPNITFMFRTDTLIIPNVKSTCSVEWKHNVMQVRLPSGMTCWWVGISLDPSSLTLLGHFYSFSHCSRSTKACVSRYYYPMLLLLHFTYRQLSCPPLLIKDCDHWPSPFSLLLLSSLLGASTSV